MFFLLKEKKQMIIIGITTFLIHASILIVSGAWWDDWKFYVMDFSDLFYHYLSAGRLDAYGLLLTVSQLPIWVFRLVVLICYLISAICIYFIFLEVFKNRNMSLIIAILYNAIPVNDIRVMRCVFPYTLAALLFWIATFLLLLFPQIPSKVCRSICRIISLVLFFVSFSTNSLMFFYLAPISLMWFMSWERLRINLKGDFIHCIKEFMRRVDFYILPFVFWVIKKIWFSPVKGGIYDGYNSVTLSRIVYSIKVIPSTTVDVMRSVIQNWYTIIDHYKWIVIVYILIFAICFLFRKRIKFELKQYSFIRSLLTIIFGIFLVVVGLYPYVVVRQGSVGVTGLAGRDAMFICLGMAVLIYGCIEVFNIPFWSQYAIIISIVVTSCIHFSSWYCLYIRDYYQQVALQIAWQEDDNVETNNTFVYISKNEGQLDFERFYTLNALSKQIFGDSSRFIAKGIEDLSYITTYPQKELMWRDVTYCYNDYDITDVSIDGIMVADYELSKRDVLLLKYYELFDYELFEAMVRDCIDYEYIAIDENVSDEIYNMISMDVIKNDDELLQFISDSHS